MLRHSFLGVEGTITYMGMRAFKALECYVCYLPFLLVLLELHTLAQAHHVPLELLVLLGDVLHR